MDALAVNGGITVSVKGLPFHSLRISDPGLLALGITTGAMTTKNQFGANGWTPDKLGSLEGKTYLIRQNRTDQEMNTKPAKADHL